MSFVTYIHASENTGIPYYIGAGKEGRERVFGNRRSNWKAARKLEGLNVTTFYWLTLEEAWAYETKLIDFYGKREDGGTLLNRGSGGPPTKGMVKTKLHRARLAASLIGKPRPDWVKAKLSEASKGQTHNRGRVHSEQSKKNMSDGHKRRKLLLTKNKHK